MRLETLGLGETDRSRPQRREARWIAADQRGALDKVEDAQTGSKACAARGRQNVIRAGYVITDGLGRVATEKDGADMMHPLGQLIGLVDRQLQVLRSNPVDQRRRLVPIGND